MIVLSILDPAAAFAQAQSTVQPHDDPAKLAEEFTDPLTTLPQVFVRDDYTPASYGTNTPGNYGPNAQLNRALVRAIIPRVPGFFLFPLVQLIRPTFQLVTVATNKRGMTRTEFGEIELFDLAVLPWPDEKSGLKIGVGPTFVFPTATSKAAGQGAWQAGPACGAALHRHARGFGRLPSAESDFLRLHVGQPQASQHNGVPANSNRSRLEGVVRQIR
jgi:hypothetical protein